MRKEGALASGNSSSQHLALEAIWCMHQTRSGGLYGWLEDVQDLNCLSAGAQLLLVPVCVDNNVLSCFDLHCKGALQHMSALLTAEGRMFETHSDAPLVQVTKRSCSSSKNSCDAGACDSTEQPDRQVLLGRQLCDDAVKPPALACLCSGPSWGCSVHRFWAKRAPFPC